MEKSEVPGREYNEFKRDGLGFSESDFNPELVKTLDKSKISGLKPTNNEDDSKQPYEEDKEEQLVVQNFHSK